MWQNSSNGKVDGMNGNVDTDYLYKDFFSKITTTTTTATTKSAVPTYKVGQTITLQVDLKVRKGAGTNYAQKKKSELTTDGQKHALNQTMAVLAKDTKVTIKQISKSNNEVWALIPSGWICAYYQGKIYAK